MRTTVAPLRAPAGGSDCPGGHFQLRSTLTGTATGGGVGSATRNRPSDDTDTTAAPCRRRGWRHPRRTGSPALRAWAPGRPPRPAPGRQRGGRRARRRKSPSHRAASARPSHRPSRTASARRSSPAYRAPGTHGSESRTDRTRWTDTRATARPARSRPLRSSNSVASTVNGLPSGIASAQMSKVVFSLHVSNRRNLPSWDQSLGNLRASFSNSGDSPPVPLAFFRYRSCTDHAGSKQRRPAVRRETRRPRSRCLGRR